MSDNKDLMQSVSDRLRFSNFDRTHIKSAVDVMAGFQKEGLTIDDVNTKGIPVPDSVVTHTRLPAAKIALLEKILMHPRVGGIEILPNGIVNPEFFNMRVTIR